MVAARLATLKRGQNQHAQICATSQAEAGTVLSVSRRSIQYAREVIENGTPELVHAVEQGNIAVSAAAVIAQKAPEYHRPGWPWGSGHHGSGRPLPDNERC
jgi:hypothetical protein